MATVQLASEGGRWLTHWFYGMDSFPNDAHLIDILKAVFVCAAGDGQISKEERDFALGYLTAIMGGLPKPVHDLFSTYEGKDKLEDLVKGDALTEGTKRPIIYTAMLIAGADGYAESEHNQIVKMGARLGLTEADVNAVRAQYEADKKMRDQRIAVLFPSTHPWKK